jgi:hypothetical protein
MITRIALWALAIAAGWLAVLAGVMLIPQAAPAALVIFPPVTLIEKLPPGVAIVSHGPFSITLASIEPGFVPDLYRAGAWLVLPAGLRGCAPLTS